MRQRQPPADRWRSVRLAATLFVLLALPAGTALAQSVALQGMLGTRALLIVDGGDPKGVAPGDSWRGVKVISTTGDTAVLEIKGQRVNLRVGDSPASVGTQRAAGSGRTITLPMGSDGHFAGSATINGQAAQFIVDTGASSVAIGVGDADRLGLNYRAGQPVRIATANGNAVGWRIKLASVRVGEVEIYEVDAVVTPQSMPYVLMGNSFLSRFQMKRENDTMTLERRF